MTSALPTLDRLLDSAVGFSIPLSTPFRGTHIREGLLLRGPLGWGEFAPFPEYDDVTSARWLSAAIEAAWIGWPEPVREVIAVNAIIPAVDADLAARLAVDAECTTAKVKVAQPGQSLEDDVARVGAVREAIGKDGRLRVDANGAWTPEAAVVALRALSEFNLEYAEQPCETLVQCAVLRRVTEVPIA